MAARALAPAAPAAGFLFGSCGRVFPYEPLKILPFFVRLSPLPIVPPVTDERSLNPAASAANSFRLFARLHAISEAPSVRDIADVRHRVSRVGWNENFLAELRTHSNAGKLDFDF